VLGPLFEQSLRQSLILSAQNPAIFFDRPISLGLLLASVLLVAFFAFDKLKKRSA